MSALGLGHGLYTFCYLSGKAIFKAGPKLLSSSLFFALHLLCLLALTPEHGDVAITLPGFLTLKHYLLLYVCVCDVGMRILENTGGGQEVISWGWFFSFLFYVG